MRFSNEELYDQVCRGNLRAVSRLITLAENRVERARVIQSKLYARGGNAHVVGVTGAPGAGKSTLVDQLAAQARAQGKRVAILAVDPSSPFSGGALLGDRIRMVKVSEDAQVYIRSMATRGTLGGLSRATLDAVQILDAAGFDLVLVETVGVGQAEVDIVRLADTCLVVMVPGMGDSVQSIKAGILEIADHFVVNKGDRDGADLLQKDLRVLLSLTEFGADDWKPEIYRTVAVSGEGVPELLAGVGQHAKWLACSKRGREKKLSIVRESILKLVSDLTLDQIISKHAADLDRLALECLERRNDPLSAALKLSLP